MNELVRSTLDLCRYDLRVNDIEIVEELGPDLLPIMADRQQLQQVVLNLVVNAEQAMREARGHGKLQIRTELDDAGVLILVDDNGPGIAPENIDRLCEPFFTTRGPGKGTDLGLSICYGIVEDHGGTITAENIHPTGARFRVRLPAESGVAVQPVRNPT